MLHESHRLIRDTSVREEITVPIGETRSTEIEFVQGEVTGLDVDARDFGSSNLQYDSWLRTPNIPLIA